MENLIEEFTEEISYLGLSETTKQAIISRAVNTFTEFQFDLAWDSSLVYNTFKGEKSLIPSPPAKPPPPPGNWQRSWYINPIPAGAVRFYIWTSRMPGRIFRLRGYERRITITASNNPIPVPPAGGDTVQFDVKKKSK